MKKLLLFCSLILGCQSLEKERLELDRQILEFEKERFQKCGCVCQDSVAVTKYYTEPVKVVSKSEKDCIKVASPSKEDIWSLAEKGGWSYSPKLLEKSEVCEDLKESFYKIYYNTDSYVAETQVPKTKKSSCINNVLFHGKDKLYDLMLEHTAKLEGIDNYEKDRYTKVKNEVIEYNTAEKGRSFYYECRPTDPTGSWNKCVCILFASYPSGRKGLGLRLKQN